MPEFQFNSLTELLNMGGYAQYVWPVYAFFLLFFLVTVIPPTYSRRKIVKQIKARLRREENQ